MTATAGAGPWSFHAHVGAWAVVAAVLVGYLLLTRAGAFAATSGQRWRFVVGTFFLAVALTWPLADLATHWSLTALVLQRLLLMLAVPAFYWLGLPEALLTRLTRPAAIDAVLRTLARPVVAVIVVTVIAVGTLTTGAVQLQATSPPGRAALDVALLFAGAVLWLPFMPGVPGVRRLGALGRVAYLIVQSIVPSFLSVVWIFARHPLYPAFSHGGLVGGLSPLLDQQIAGFVAKLLTISVLWTVAFVSLRRTSSLDESDTDQRLTWADVERHLLRVERHERRHGEAPPGEPVPGGPGEEGDRPPRG